MEWKLIESVDNKYEVNEYGVVRNIKTKRELKPHINKYGYLQLNLYDKSVKLHCKKIHRIVAEVFLPRINNKNEVNHIDGNKLNNHISNLEWCTRSENINHALQTGLTVLPSGENHCWSKITKDIVFEILKLLEDGDLNHKEIAEKLNITRPTVSNISCGSSWKKVIKEYKELK